MAAMVPSRVIAPPPNWLELPSLPHPQYVHHDGHEIDEPEAENDIIDMTSLGETEDDDAKPELAASGTGMEIDGDTGEPLLSISDSLVMVQALKQSRQRHMQRLLPLIFTHPPLPSYQKPRARGPPKSTFLFPTPEGPTAPLPYREYHGPRKVDAGDAGSPGGAKADDGQTTSAARSKARAKRAAELDEAAPAHETECIARVTLTIGPFSYHETELWIGRFVEPRAEAGKAIKADKKAKMPAGDADLVKKRVVPTAKPNITPNPVHKPLGGIGMPYRPPMGNATAGPSGIRPPSHSSATPGPSGTSSKPPPKPEGAINPDLIKKVNLAAATRPWLSDIIHKAARKQASKEELARLGRAVGRLNRGEDVDGGEAANAAVAGVPASAVPPRVAAADGTSRSSSPLTSELDSDSEVSDVEGEAKRKGPKQVGGGPVTGVSSAPTNANNPDPTSPRVPTSYNHFNPSIARPQSSQPRPIPIPTASLLGGAYPRPPPMPNHAFPQTSIGTSSQTPLPMPPPPPRPVYAKVPPFLFIAFKDSPTEKYLIPLGSNSFITRTGGDNVTHPRPVLPPPHAPPASISQVAPLVTSQQPQPTPPAEPLATVNITAKLRTRASLGKAPKAEIAKVEKAKTPTPEPAVSPHVPEPPPRRVAPPPAPGTVTVSTLMPTGSWATPDWPRLERALPWVNPIPASASRFHAFPTTSSQFPPGAPISGTQGYFASPGSTPAPVPAPPRPATSPPNILNLGAVDLTPPEGDLQPTTIRLSGIDDHAWMRMKQVIDIVEMTELGELGRKEPGLLQMPNSQLDTKPLIGGHAHPPAIPAFRNPAAQENVRRTYFERKKARFARLLTRTPTRSFLRLRTEYVDSALVDSITDKWAPRPYSISTKSLYTRSPPPEDDTDQAQYGRFSPEKPAKKRKSNVHEPAVAFEMPVSLDALDERVEEGAKFALARRGRPKGARKSGGGRASKARASDAAEDGSEGQKKSGLTRGKTGAVCEGCASTSLKVWRKGPGGSGTLCKDCGDAYNAGTLGELKAPGAMSKGQIKAEPSSTTVAPREAENGNPAPEQPPAISSDEAGQVALAQPSTTIAPAVLTPVAEVAVPGPSARDEEANGGGMIVE